VAVRVELVARSERHKTVAHVMSPDAGPRARRRQLAALHAQLCGLPADACPCWRELLALCNLPETRRTRPRRARHGARR
jgi:hypothetical protein